MIRYVFRNIFSQKKYLALTLGIAFLIFSVVLFFPNISLLREVLHSGQFTLQTKLTIILSLYGSIATNFSIISVFIIGSTAILFGINSTLVVYLFQNRQSRKGGQGLAIGAGGLLSGLLGIGCAACGSLLFVGLLPFLGGAGLLALLPFGGEEFGFLGLVLLLWSTYLLVKSAYPVCTSA